LTELGFDVSDTIDSINNITLNKKSIEFMTSDKYNKSKLTEYDKLGTYIRLKNLIEKLNLPEEIKSIKDRSEYQKRFYIILL